MSRLTYAFSRLASSESLSEWNACISSGSSMAIRISSKWRDRPTCTRLSADSRTWSSTDTTTPTRASASSSADTAP